MSDIFRLLTPVTYWILIALWSFILYFYMKKMWRSKTRYLFLTLIVILAIDAFRTLFESIYFGIWYTSLAGLIPMSIGVFLMRPEMVIIPKVLNVIAAVVVIALLLKRWLPKEEEEQVRLGAALQESEARWQFAVDSSEFGLWDWNMQTNEVFFSKQWKKMIGFKEDEISGSLEEWDKRVYPDDKEKCYEDIKKHQDAITPIYTNEHRILCKDNTYKWILARGKVISWTDDGKPMRMIGTHTDISDRKQAEKVLQKALDELELRVEERTLQLRETHEMLLHSEKLSAIGSLSASIAHEFNNPLQGVMTVLKGVKRRSPLDEEDAKLIDMAVCECDRMKDLIKNLQDFNRPSSGRVAPIDIHATIDSLLMLSKKEYQAKGLIVVTHYAEDVPQINAVADQIKQVVLNLLNNAAYACEGGGKITISTEVINTDIIIKIQDSGTGIKPEHMDKIFDPFFTTKPAIKGTGLGLSISYGIIKKHGGRIDVASDSDRDTIFTIILPIWGVTNEEKINPAR